MDEDKSLSELGQAIHAALKSWDKPNDKLSPLASLRVFQQFQADDTNSPHQKTNKFLYHLLETLRNDNPESSELLSRHFLDGETIQHIANSVSYSPATINRKQSEAIDQLALILQAKEVQARDKQRDIWQARLERPTYIQLIGVEDHLDQLLNLLIAPGPPWLVSIEGLGGIGKTSLAGALARWMIRRGSFNDFGWVSARQQIFKLTGEIKPVALPAALTPEDLVDKLLAQLLPDLPQPETLAVPEARALLQTRLKQTPHLIVIDNLETLPDVEELLPVLRDLVNPSKFLLTSRESLYHEPGLYHFPLPELSEANTLRLIRYEIEQHNHIHLQQAGDDDLKKIYQAVGGNPLAIRLVMGQTHVFALDTILADLIKAQGQSIEALYTFIYRRAWDALDEPTRELFLAMLPVTDGGELVEELVASTGLDTATVYTSLKRLVDLNLVNSSGDHAQRYYNIHNLTRTFLREQVLRWKQ